ncbi:putative DNA primase/helicase [Dethiosulfatibacter aminovorans DSM 17477]|uniref:Putative DNA primase/helicase n=1 Tax=Dethiosulfatibacter aminovorans DSM 17477 TaxID=1121476 RepID=A0A1M6EP78_9FIRM|nr:DUF5906 domain-containing protein [Dethiosulfatibacter aminovorans]SHI87295.1 putative DNA primase/helicase [Dethiosulfatibacter aminovorans DSM 17477]
MNAYNSFKNIPEELKMRPQWVLWKLETVKGKETKIPYQINGWKASTTRPRDWTTFEKALVALNNWKYSGLGFVFSGDDPYIGVDLDHIVAETGVFSKEALEIIQKLDSYTEFSQSKTGAHIILKAKNTLGSGRKSKDKMLEVYSEKRFFVMTGNIVPETRKEIIECQEAFDKLAYKYLTSKQKPKKPVISRSNLEDRVIIGKLEKNPKFNALYYHGDLSSYRDDWSAADMALCNLIAFYTEDTAQVDSIFRKSALYREKWDREDYRQRTIDKAFANRTACYDPYHGRNTDTEDFNDLSDKPEIKQLPFLVLKNINKPDNGLKVDVARLAIYMKNVYRVKIHNGIFRSWRKNYYASMDDIKVLIYEAIPELYRNPRDIKACEELLRMDGTIILKDQDLAPPKYFLFLNGVLNIENMEFYPHGSENVKNLIFIYCVDFNWNPNVEDDVLVDKFFEDITGGKDEDTNFLYQVLGVAMSNYRDFKNILYFSGEKDSGKSQFMHVVEKLLKNPDGSADYSSIGLKTLTDENSKEFFQIAGKRANICGETPELNITNDVLLKQLSGGDTVTANRKFLPPVSFVNRAMLIFSGNRVPKFFVGDKSAIADRLMVYEFKQAIPKSRQIKNIYKQFDFEYIIKKSIDNLKLFVDSNQEFLQISELSSNRERLLKDSDFIYKFYKEACISTENREDRYSSEDLWKCFLGFLVEEGHIERNALGKPDIQRLKVKKHNFITEMKRLHGESNYARNVSYKGGTATCLLGLQVIRTGEDTTGKTSM